MLDVGFSELLLIAVVALVVVGPKDIPVVMKHVFAFLRELRGIYTGIKTQMVQMVDEAGINDLKREMNTIIDLEGKPQQAYDVSELKQFRSVGPESEHDPKLGKTLNHE